MNKARTVPIFSVSISDETYGDASPITLQGGFEKNLLIASQMGFGGVEIQTHTPSRFDWTKLEDTVLKNNLMVTAFGTGLEYGVNHLCFTSSDSSIRKQINERFKEYIKLASRFGSVVFIGLCRGTAPSYAERQKYLNMLKNEIEPLYEYASSMGVVLVLEPIVFYLTNLLNTTQEAMEFLDVSNFKNIRLLLDTHHMFIEDKDYIQSFRDAGNLIAHIHISDSNRCYAGAGNVDYTAVGAVLKEIGYTHPVSLETLPIPTGEVAAKKSLEWMQGVWS